MLEIGCGCGSEAERFARSGARYTALDLTNAALSVTRKRFQLASLEGCFVQGDAESLPFRDCSFEFVYSHGVLHHTPDTPRTICEIHRVLSFGGRAVVMLYYRDSFNYHVNLRIVRRLRARLLRTERGIKLACAFFGESEKNLRRQAELIRLDPHSYLEPQNMLNRNTDGPDNPLSQVFLQKVSGGHVFAIQGCQNQRHVLEPELASGHRKAAAPHCRGLAGVALGLAPLDLRAEEPYRLHRTQANSALRTAHCPPRAGLHQKAVRCHER